MTSSARRRFDRRKSRAGVLDSSQRGRAVTASPQPRSHSDGGATVLHTCRYDAHIDVLTARIVRRVKDLGSTLPTLPGCAELTAAKLISEATNVDRFPNESAFARYGGLAPIPAWSGSTNGRLRVCHSGNRQINTAIHHIAVVQLRLDCAGKDYYQRRRAAGDSGASAVRCLKRRLFRVVFNRMRADYARRPSLDTGEP